MSKLPPLRTLRLLPRSNYDRFVGSRGDVYYDPVNDTLRVMDSEVAGGSILATRNWVNTGSTVNYNNLTNKPTLATVATTGSYTDLINRPEQFNWRIAADDSTLFAIPANETLQIRGTGTVTTSISQDSTGVQLVINGFSGNYNDLTNKPTVFSGSYNDLADLPTEFSNLTGLGFARGVPVAEFSTDQTFEDNSTDTVPVEQAIRGYIDRRLGFDAEGTGIPGIQKIGPQYVITDGQQRIDLGTTRSTTDGDFTINAEAVMLASWQASLTTTRTLNIANLTRGRMVKVYVRNTNGSSRTVQVAASTTESGFASVNLAPGAGAASVTQITLAATTGTAVITVWNAQDSIVGMVN